MTIQPHEAEQQVQDYLAKFSRAMKDADPELVLDISNELKSHLKEQIEAETNLTTERLAELFANLGEPEVLAVQYRTEALIKQASYSSSPVVVIRAVFRWAMLSGLGIVSLVTAVIGYGLSFGWIGSAILKPFFPERVGLWVDFPTIHIGFNDGSSSYQELMGWWIIPIGLVAGTLFFIGTTKLMKFLMASYGPRTRKR